MKCPHCLVMFHDVREVTQLKRDKDASWGIVSRHCPSCQRLILSLAELDIGPLGIALTRNEALIRPRTSSRPPVPLQVSEEFAEDYREACLVLPDSPKASAALSRRCLQHILREKAGVKSGNLSNEIQEVIDSNSLPSDISDSIDLIRNIGNFAAHPIKTC